MRFVEWLGDRGIPMFMFGVCIAFAAGSFVVFDVWLLRLWGVLVFGVLAGLFMFTAEAEW